MYTTQNAELFAAQVQEAIVVVGWLKRVNEPDVAQWPQFANHCINAVKGSFSDRGLQKWRGKRQLFRTFIAKLKCAHYSKKIKCVEKCIYYQF